jgi:hypothetical protein
VTHVLQRSDGGDGAGSVTTYRGPGRQTEVSGLSPNTLYKFTLRLISSRSHSKLSQACEVRSWEICGGANRTG